MPQLPLDATQIERVKEIAAAIAEEIQQFVRQYSSVSIERTVLRLYGVDGTDRAGTPLPNRLIELFQQGSDLSRGISTPFVATMLACGKDPQVTAELIGNEELSFRPVASSQLELAKQKEAELAAQAITLLDASRRRKREKIAAIGLPRQPWRYLIVATGDVYTDRTQALSAVLAGADIIAQIRSTAQSLLDYVPYGPTTEGFGGTYATQANFRIMRDALDDISQEQQRYIRLVNYSSGLCMAEIAACAALEDLDILLNDSMYGILFRDINMERTFIDQYFSRLICARANILINTGEDNYLTTADALDEAHTVTASQLINEAMGKQAGLTDDLLGLGHAFEIDPTEEDSLLYEIAHAQLARQLFPEAPLKYMPPTKYKRTDIFYSHALDTLFNLTSVTTGQGIHLAGILTEAIHTPFMQDRSISLQSVNYVFQAARRLGREIDFKPDGFIARRAQYVLDQAETLLSQIHQTGLMDAIEQARFAGISRSRAGGKGLTGVFRKGPDYSNPILSRLAEEGPTND